MSGSLNNLHTVPLEAGILPRYFAKWPFSSAAPSKTTASEYTTRLPFYALVWANAFLCERHSKILIHYNDKRDAHISRRKEGLALEYILQALAINEGQGTITTAPASSSLSSRSLCNEVLDTLNIIQPFMNEFAPLINRDKLFALATRLVSPLEVAAPAASLSSLNVPTAEPGGMVELLNLFVLLLRHATKFDQTTTPGILVKDLETALELAQRHLV